jgi:uncharacterized protein
MKNTDICIIGLGPAGIGAALHLARAGLGSNVVCFDAGEALEVKYCSILQGKGCRHSEPCQIISGLGGSSVLSGGKISAYPAGRALGQFLKSPQSTEAALNGALVLFSSYVPLSETECSNARQEQAVKEYQDKGFDFRYYNALLYQQADLLAGYQKMVSELCSLGTIIHLQTRVQLIEPTPQGFLVHVESNKGNDTWCAKRVILAVGREGIDLMQKLRKTCDLEIETGNTDIGVRLELPLHLWENIDAYHNDLKLHFGNARTFCVCKGGILAPYKVNSFFSLEGSDTIGNKTGYTNFAITIRKEHLKEGEQTELLLDVESRMKQQSRGIPVREMLQDYLTGNQILQKNGTRKAKLRDASISFWRWGSVSACFPSEDAADIRTAVEYFVDRLMPKNVVPQVSVFGPVIDYYWPRFRIGSRFLATGSNVYIIGDGTGHFRGILQAFCSGIECANGIVEELGASREVHI